MRIALAGPSGAGKTKIAKHLRDHHNFHIVSLMDPVRQMAETVGRLFDVHQWKWRAIWELRATLDWQQIKRQFAPMADLYVGTVAEAIRDVLGPNLIPQMALNEAAKHSGPVVVDDMRKIRELELFRADGWQCFYVRRTTGWIEVQPGDCDEIIDNEGGEDLLFRKVDEMIASMSVLWGEGAPS